MKLFAGKLIDGQTVPDAVIIIENGLVRSVRSPADGEAPDEQDIDGRGALVVPGFIDTHVHGGFGFDLMEGSVETVQALARQLPSVGVTAFLVTPLTAPWPAIRNAVAAANDVRNRDSGGAAVIGCHLEGPFLNPQYKGAQRADEMQLPSWDALRDGLGDLLDAVRIVTLAPEMDGALETIRSLRSAGIQASLGHTAATYDEVSGAIDAGATRATHCFNAMRGLHHREPGTVGAVLAREELIAELIWDNIHVHPAVCKTLCAAKGPAGVVAISDGTTGVGKPEGYRFNLWGLSAIVKDGGARLEDGTLAGSSIGMIDAFRNAARELDLEAAVRLCSRNPADSLGITDRGNLSVGSQADFVVLESDLTIRSTYIGGKRVYQLGQN